MTTASIRTYVINLDNGRERLEAVSRMLVSFGMEFERIPAFDGRKLDLDEISDYDASRAELDMGRSLVGAEIGCYRSHLAAATQFLQSDAQYGLVFEDDVLLRCNPMALLKEALPVLESVDKDWLLLNIGANKSRITTPVSHHDVGDHRCSLVAAHYFPMMAYALVWSREGARQFVENHDKIFAPVDNYFRYWLTRAGHGYAFWPAPVTTTDAQSQIAASDGSKRNTYGRKWHYDLSKHKRLIEDKLIALGARQHFKTKAAPRKCANE